MTITPAQCRAARGLLDWRQAELADAAGVGLSTVRDLETARRGVSPKMSAAIRTAIEEAGIELLTNGGRTGVRFLAGVVEPDPREKRAHRGNTRPTPMRRARRG